MTAVGDVLLINGQTQPHYEIAAGQAERWRIIDAASSRYVRLSLGGRSFRVIGSDGGLLESPMTVTETLLAPAVSSSRSARSTTKVRSSRSSRCPTAAPR